MAAPGSGGAPAASRLQGTSATSSSPAVTAAAVPGVAAGPGRGLGAVPGDSQMNHAVHGMAGLRLSHGAGGLAAPLAGAYASHRMQTPGMPHGYGSGGVPYHTRAGTQGGSAASGNAPAHAAPGRAVGGAVWGGGVGGGVPAEGIGGWGVGPPPPGGSSVVGSRSVSSEAWGGLSGGPLAPAMPGVGHHPAGAYRLHQVPAGRQASAPAGLYGSGASPGAPTHGGLAGTGVSAPPGMVSYGAPGHGGPRAAPTGIDSSAVERARQAEAYRQYMLQQMAQRQLAAQAQSQAASHLTGAPPQGPPRQGTVPPVPPIPGAGPAGGPRPGGHYGHGNAGLPGPQTQRDRSSAGPAHPEQRASAAGPTPRGGPGSPPVQISLSSSTARPKETLVVRLQGPAPVSAEEYVGLFRSNQRDSQKYLVLKTLRRPARIRAGERYKRHIRFYAPRGHGNYEFRVFNDDAADPDEPVAVSELLRVEIQGVDLPESLRFVAKQLGELTFNGDTVVRRDVYRASFAISSLRTLLQRATEVLRNKDTASAVWRCVCESRRQAMDLAQLLDRDDLEDAPAEDGAGGAGGHAGEPGAAPTAPPAAGAPDAEGRPRGESSADGGDGAGEGQGRERVVGSAWKERERACFHAAVRSVMDEVLSKPSLRVLLSPERLRLLRSWRDSYCPISERLLLLPGEDADVAAAPRGGAARGDKSSAASNATAKDLERVGGPGGLPKHVAAHIEETFGIPATALVPPQLVPDAVCEKISDGVMKKVADLLPGADFGTTRLELCTRLSSMLSGLPEGTSIQMFGSTVNGFGSATSDVDMCLIQSAEAAKSKPWDPVEIVGAAASMLEASGMKEVNARTTSRIPIVMFVDPVTGLSCDLCASNPLALRNTALLRAFAQIDARVRPLAYTLKHWASRRQINNPSGATLSSYGYLLLMLHHLMSRPEPIVPCLAALPPDWSAPTFEFDTPTSHLPNVLHPNAEKRMYDTYFYDPSDFSHLRAVAARNKESIGRLLLTFFWTYAFDFDSRRHVVSIRARAAGGGAGPRTPPVLKEDKVDQHKWNPRPLLAIEDPFEHDYDVAHVLRHTTNSAIKAEMARAYALLVSGDEGVSGLELLAKVAEPAPEPPYVRREHAKSDADELVAADSGGTEAATPAGNVAQPSAAEVAGSTAATPVVGYGYPGTSAPGAAHAGHFAADPRGPPAPGGPPYAPHGGPSLALPHGAPPGYGASVAPGLAAYATHGALAAPGGPVTMPTYGAPPGSTAPTAPFRTAPVPDASWRGPGT